MKAEPTSRDLRKRETMRVIQSAALDLFEASGFAAVTMEQIAAAARIGVATVYRHFGTKERVVLWDEYDPLLLERIEQRADSHVLEAARRAIVESLESFYAADRPRILRRAALIAATPTLATASLSELARLRTELARMFKRRKLTGTALESEVAAGAVVGCLQAAVDAWLRAQGRPKLGRLVSDAFDALRLVAAPSKRG